MAQRTCTIEGCARKRFGLGLCNMHYSRLRRHGDPLHSGRVIYGTPEERFWAKVDKDGPGGCWLWTASLDGSGYGMFGARATRADHQTVRAHRWAYEQLVGPIPAGLELDHVHERGCRHRHCVNPDHLEPVTSLENTKRSTTHYGARTHCSNGHEFTPENTLPRPDGGRRCRTCKRLMTQRRRQAARLRR